MSCSSDAAKQELMPAGHEHKTSEHSEESMAVLRRRCTCAEGSRLPRPRSQSQPGSYYPLTATAEAAGYVQDHLTKLQSHAFNVKRPLGCKQVLVYMGISTCF